MVGAMLHRWLTASAVSRVVVVKPSPLAKELLGHPTSHVEWYSQVNQIPDGFSPDIIVIATRPKDIVSTLPSYCIYKNSLFLSVAAGKKIPQLEEILGTGFAILRSMPNVASEVGAGMTFMTANTNVTAEQKKQAESLLQAIGQTAWLDDESLFDLATAISGCGPGFMFALVESLAKVGSEAGLPMETAILLARQTVVGSGALLGESDQSAAELRAAIGNPGTMTAAGLSVFTSPTDGILPLLNRTIIASVDHAQKLAKAS